MANSASLIRHIYLLACLCNPDYKNRSLIVHHLAGRSGNLGSFRSIVINLFSNIFHALCPISFSGVSAPPNPTDTPHPADVSLSEFSVALMLRVEKSTISVPRINQLGGVKKNRNSEKRQSNNEFFFIFIYLGKIVAAP